MSATGPLLEAQHLTIASGGTAVLRDLSFTLQPGRILGLIGESGAGKTMLGRTIARQLPPSFAVAHGSLAFQDQNLMSLSPAAHRALLGRRIAFIPQEPMSALNPSLTIGRHFAEHWARLDMPKAERRKATLAALAEMRLPQPETVFDKYPFQLSGGMCQRVLIALAFAGKPDLVIADEPTASLDVTTQVHIIGLLRGLQRRHGTGILFITHQLRLVAHLCDEVAVLYAGEIVEYGAAKAIFRRPRHPYTQALERSSPSLSGRWQPLASPTGHMPGLAELRDLAGCRFAPRCGSATEACIAAPPALHVLDGGTQLRCIRDDAVPAAEAAKIAPPLAVEATAAPALLQVENLFKVFRSGAGFRRRSETNALNDVSFSIAPGEFVGVVGETGSGKSTLGRILMGLERPSAGRILLDGTTIGDSAEDWHRRTHSVQLVFQDPRSALNPRRNVLSLVTQPLQTMPQTRQDLLNRATLLVEDVGLPKDVILRLPSQMSGGQCQRVNIARGLCATPRLLVADEITSGLDVSIQAQILNLLLQLQRDYQIALLMISHDLAVIRYLCSRVLVMYRGAIVESGPTEQVFATPQHGYTRELMAAVPPEDLNQPWLGLAS